MALHTQFFWEGLTDTDNPQEKQPGINTTKHINEVFEGGVDQLRVDFLEAADSIFGNGFVWLMKAPVTGGLSILCTYNAGSPHKNAAPRRDDKDMANFDGRQIGAQLSTRGNPLQDRSRAVGTAGAFGNSSAARPVHYQGLLDAGPVLCANVWQHQWLPDYGMFGRRDYLANWWDHIDWNVVERRLAIHDYQDGDSRSRGTSGYAQLMRSRG
jgi:Fe-Mn family superoxide dismutase